MTAAARVGPISGAHFKSMGTSGSTLDAIQQRAFREIADYSTVGRVLQSLFEYINVSDPEGAGVPVVDLQGETGNDMVKLCLTLGRGAFAISVLREIAEI